MLIKFISKNLISLLVLCSFYSLINAAAVAEETEPVFVGEKTPEEMAREVREMEEKAEAEAEEAIGVSREVSPADPTKKTIEFLVNSPAPYTLNKEQINFAADKIIEGRNVLQKVLSGELREETNPAKYLDLIIAINWALFSKAVNKGQGFAGGTIVVEDPQDRLFNFLLNYVRLVGDVKCLGYSRSLSTHFEEAKKVFDGVKAKQYGIDMRYSARDKLNPWLPNNKAHLLFGKTGNNLTFVKWETFGTSCTIGEWAAHMKEWAKSKEKKGGLSRREDVPKDAKKEYHAFVDKFDKAKTTIAVIKPKVEFIRNMYDFAKKIHAATLLLGLSFRRKQLPEKSRTFELLSQEANSFIKYLTAHFDHLEARRGNEVIVSTSEIIKL